MKNLLSKYWWVVVLLVLAVFLYYWFYMRETTSESGTSSSSAAVAPVDNSCGTTLSDWNNRLAAVEAEINNNANWKAYAISTAVAGETEAEAITKNAVWHITQTEGMCVPTGGRIAPNPKSVKMN